MARQTKLARWGWVAACLLASVAFVSATARSSTLWSADLYAGPYRDRIPQWASGAKRYTPQDIKAAQADLLTALRIRPTDGGTHELLATLYNLQAQARWDDLAQRRQGLALAAQHLNESVRLRPFLAQPRANLALLAYMQDAPADVVFGHWRAALELGPYEQSTRTTLLNVSLGLWAESPQVSKDWVKSLKTAPRPFSKTAWARWEAYFGVELE